MIPNLGKFTRQPLERDEVHGPKASIDDPLAVDGRRVTDNLSCLSDLKTKKKPVNAHIFSFFTRLYTNFFFFFEQRLYTNYDTISTVLQRRFQLIKLCSALSLKEI